MMQHRQERSACHEALMATSQMLATESTQGLEVSSPVSRCPVVDRREATRASPGCQAERASAVEQLRHLLIHCLAEGSIHMRREELG